MELTPLAMTRSFFLFLFGVREEYTTVLLFYVETTKPDTTVAGGSLGWWIDEERSELR